MSKSAALHDEKLWRRVDEVARRIARLETLAKETRRKVTLLEKYLDVHARDDLGMIVAQRGEENE